VAKGKKRRQYIMNEAKKSALKRGLKALGAQGKYRVYRLQGDHRAIVVLGGKYFGIWDSLRETFVD
jgi:hypothetical protein